MNNQLSKWPPENTIILSVDSSKWVNTNGKNGGEPCAEISPQNNDVVIRDLGGTVPVLLDGQEFSGRVQLQPGTVISIGTWQWTVPQPPKQPLGQMERSQRRQSIVKSVDGLHIRAENLSFTVTVRESPTSPSKQLQLLKNISLAITPGEFVGIVGASGSGKSTLLRTLNCDNVPQSGRVLYNGVVAETFLAKSPGRLAYLPQDLILHNELTPRQALKYTARLRNIPEIDKTVKEVLKQVGLSEHADKKIKNLSGGQKKRAGLATELLSRPEAIFLDEATSGLDPLGEKEMMRLFRDLADSGITVICITHFPGQLTLCDRILAVDKGRLVLNDSPERILKNLNIPSFEDIYDKLGTLPQVSVKSEEQPPQKKAKVSAKQQQALTPPEQTAILFQRYAHITLKDWKTLLLFILQPPIISGLIGLTFGNIVTGFAERHSTDIKQVAFLLLLAILWCSSMNGVREIIKERSILKHERRFGLSPIAYLASKFLLLAIIGVGQAVVLALVLCAITGLQASGPLALVIVILVGLAGTALGLTVSAIVQSSERAMTLLPIILIGEAVYSGGLANMTGLNRIAAMLLSSSYWGLEGLKSLLPNNLLYATYPSAVGHYQPPILGVPFPYPVDAFMLLVQTAALLFFAWVFVRKIKA